MIEIRKDVLIDILKDIARALKWLYIIFIVYLTLFFTALYFIFKALGALNLMLETYGKAMVAFFIVLPIIILFLVVLFCLIKNKVVKKVVHSILILCVLTYTIVPYRIEVHLCNKYSAFSYKEWNEKLAVRSRMYKALEKDLNIIGLNPGEIINLIGEPNLKDEKGFQYATNPGYIFIGFQGNKANEVIYVIPD